MPIILSKRPGGGGSGGGVTSLDGLTGAVTLSEGDGIDLVTAGQDIEIAAQPVAYGEVKLTSGDLTGLNSGTFADITGATVTITTRARRARVTCIVEAEGQAIGQDVFIDLAVDGTRQGGTNGLVRTETYSGSRFPMGFSYTTAVLTAAAHTFKLQYRVGSDTLTIFAGAEQPLVLQVEELPETV